MLSWAASQNLLVKMGLDAKTPRASIFADDAIIFFSPVASDLQVVSAILELFGEASGLRINFEKSSVTGIRCGDPPAREVALSLTVGTCSSP